MKIDLCKLLRVKEGEEFKIEGYNLEYRYKVYNNRIQYFDEVLEQWDYSSLSVNALVTSELIKLPKKKKFTDDELCILRNIDKEYKWITKDRTGEIWIYADKPKKEDKIWNWTKICSFKSLEMIKNSLFTEIKWEDEEPVYIDDYVNRQNEVK